MSAKVSSTIAGAIENLAAGNAPVYLVARLEPFLRGASADPRRAVPSKALLAALRKIASVLPSALVDARDPREMLRLLALPRVVMAGSHGMDILHPEGLRTEEPDAVAFIPMLDKAEHALWNRLHGVRGAYVARSRFVVGVHAGERAAMVREAVDEVGRLYPGLSRVDIRPGLCEFRPGMRWDSSLGLERLQRILNRKEKALPLFIGSIRFDAPALQAAARRGLAACAGPEPPPEGVLHLPGPDDLRRFLAAVGDQFVR